MQEETLPITGYHSEPLPNRFFRQEQATTALALILPGYGYTCAMQLCYYMVNHLFDRGFDILQVEYTYSQRPDYRARSEDERLAWLLADVQAAWQVGRAQRAYQRIVFGGKSLGTRALPSLLKQAADTYTIQTIWLTPLFREAPIQHCLLTAPAPALIIAGTADPFFDPTIAATLQTIPARQLCLIPEADHSLEYSGDIARSIQSLAQAIESVQRFLA